MFERLEETINGITQSVKVGATTLAGTINLNSKIEDEKKVIAKAYAELGEKYYAEKKEDVPEGYEDIFADLKSSIDKINDYQARLKKLSGLVVCPECGKEQSKDYCFCMACGAKLPEDTVEEEPEKEEEPDYTKCQECGAPVKEGAAFCVCCGAKLPEIPVEEEEIAEDAAEEAPAEEEKTEE